MDWNWLFLLVLGWLFQADSNNIIVQQLLAYLTKRKQCSSSRLSHKQCYEEFGQYLEENNLYLSQEAADQWIASIQGKYNRQKCYFWRQYISQLIVFQTTGSISDALFYQIQSSYDKVPDSLKYYLDLYLENCRSRYTGRSFEIAKVHCSRIMYYLSEQGITEIQEISFFCDWYADPHRLSLFQRYKGTSHIVHFYFLIQEYLSPFLFLFQYSSFHYPLNNFQL